MRERHAQHRERPILGTSQCDGLAAKGVTRSETAQRASACRRSSAAAAPGGWMANCRNQWQSAAILRTQRAGRRGPSAGSAQARARTSSSFLAIRVIRVLRVIRVIESTYIQLLLSLREALAVDSVNQIHDRVYLREVVLPHLARNLVATEVKGAELDLRDRELLRSCGRRGNSGKSG